MTTPEKFRIFVFSKTVGYRHDSIPAGIEGLKRLGAASTTNSSSSFSFTVEEIGRAHV